VPFGKTKTVGVVWDEFEKNFYLRNLKEKY